VTLIEGWNGTTWSLQPSANPDGAPQNTLLGVSCPAATVCVAVGNYEDSSGTQRVLVER